MANEEPRPEEEKHDVRRDRRRNRRQPGVLRRHHAADVEPVEREVHPQRPQDAAEDALPPRGDAGRNSEEGNDDAGERRHDLRPGVVEEVGAALGGELRVGAEVAEAVAHRVVLPLAVLDEEVRNGRIRYVIPDGIGHAGVLDDIPAELISRAIEDLRKKC